ncbi:MAG TPA: L-seryl-tRNA(Sec) selenium transferase [Drouetiella sp.]
MTTDVKRIPQVDKVLRHPQLVALQSEFRRDVIAEVARRVLQSYRSQEKQIQFSESLDEVAIDIENRLKELVEGNLRKVINGTGIILSTNLGRAPLPEAAVKKASEILHGYANLEIDLDDGKRGERIETISELLALLTKCEAAIIVNNNAAAVVLAVRALAHEKEVIVSRGELIEIGGSFRLPDVIESAGASLKEVGTTNRTRASDFEKSISEKTGFLLKCHRSNFEITGFTESASTAELVAIGAKHNIPVIEDLGSGALVDYTKIGMKYEPTVAEVIQHGVDVVMFSGDKLMGGSQSGIICGKAKYIELLRKNPMYRALRADKLTIALLEQVLCQYLRPNPEKIVPVMRMALTAASELRDRVNNFIHGTKINAQYQLEPIELSSAFGGGTLPGQTLESFGIAISTTAKLTPDKLLKKLRKSSTPVIGIIHNDKVVIDFRTITLQEETLLRDSLQTCLS